MQLASAFALTIWALLWFFASLAFSGFAFVALVILWSIEAACKFVGRAWRIS